jgi:hypothetical protein
MPFGDNDWLALIVEPTGDPICDRIITSGIAHRAAAVPALPPRAGADIHAGHNAIHRLRRGGRYRATGPEEMRRFAKPSSSRGLLRRARAVCTTRGPPLPSSVTLT